jgi:hypothetical protein
MIDRQEMLLIQLMEEAGEVVQAASKVLRFGPTHTWPNHEGAASQRLENEIIDLMALVSMLQDEGILAQWTCSVWGADMWERIQVKERKVNLYMETSKELGRVQRWDRDQ